MSAVDDILEDLEFLDSTGVGATEAARRTDFPSAHAMEKWLERHGRNDLWQRLKHRDPAGMHPSGSDRKKRALMSTPTADDTFARLLDNGEASTRARTRGKAARARALLHDLRVILHAEAQEDEQRSEATAEVERLTRELAEARARLRGGSGTTLVVDGSVTAAELRQWARENGVECNPVGLVPRNVREAYDAAQREAS